MGNAISVIVPLFIYVANILSIIGLVFFSRKDMSVTFAWLLVLIFLPLVGFILYFFFGSTSKLEVMSRKYNMGKIEEYYHKLLQISIEAFKKDAFKDDRIAIQDPKTARFKDMILMNSVASRCFFTEDNTAKLLVDGQEKFPLMFKEISEAKESINVLYFIFKTKDKIGRDLIELLAKKAAQGVEVKVVYDALGDYTVRLKDFDPIVKNGGQVQKFLPSLVSTLLSVNYRLHRKVVVIDGRIAYTGGINIGDDYLGLYPKMSPWRDTSIRVTGSAVSEMQLRFFEDWVFLEKQNKKYIGQKISELPIETFLGKYFHEPDEKGKSGVQIISCGPDNHYATHRDSYMKIITSAREYLYIQTPYFVPDQGLMDSLRIAAQSGVDVRVMLPGIPDKKFVYYVTLSYVQELLENGIRVYIHPGFLHSKTFVIDDQVSSIGTTNFDIRSFKLDYEVNTMVYNEEFALTCKQTFLKDAKQCKELMLENYKKRGKAHYFMESLCRFIAPLA